MLQISKLTDYATVIMSFLAKDPERVFSASLIAKELHLAIPTVSKVLKILAGAELAVSFRGSEGGYQLARPTREITVADVIFAMQGKIALTECCAPKQSCVIHSLCAIRESWKSINNIIFGTLSQITLHDMTNGVVSHPLALRGIPIKIEEVKHG